MDAQATSTAAASSLAANPTTPAYSDDVEWVTAYFVIHMLSDSSRRYAYLMWIIVVFVFLIFGVLHWTGSRGGFIGAYWSKWSLRRRTWRKKHAIEVSRTKGKGHTQAISLPSNAQLLSVTVLLIASLALAFVGPDYIAPGMKLWQFYGPNVTSTLRTRATSYDPSTFYQYQPQYTIPKAWWTSGGRTGLIAFALFPLCVLFALKAPPFALFAIPFMIQLHFDKLAFLHRWSGRLIWLMSALHVALWSVQLAKDHRQATGEMAYQYAWLYGEFIYGWIAFGLLTFLIVFSLFPVRRTHYEVFYFLHVLLVPGTLVMAAVHHPPVWWWCWAALALWAGERLWRGTWWLHINGFFGGLGALTPAPAEDFRPMRTPHTPNPRAESWELKALRPLDPESVPDPPLHTASYPSPSPSAHPFSTELNGNPPLNDIDYRQPARSPYASHPPQSWGPHQPNSPFRSSTRLLAPPVGSTYLPPPGYAHAELLSGHTVRLRLITPGYLSWAPGQHFLIRIPSISKVTSHPFTVASVCDEQAPTDLGRELVLLVRAKQGWTKELWDRVVMFTARGQHHPPHERPPKGAELPHRGVLMRMYVDGPYGSAARARWGNHSTVLIVTGGSGVSFGLSVLQYVCMCLSGRDGKHLGGRPGGWGMKRFMTTRVRFVWLVREFSHIQWCASILRRCMAMIPAPGLQVDIFVTNFKPISPGRPRRPRIPLNVVIPDSQDGSLAPPTPGFARESRSHSRSNSADSSVSHGTGSPTDSLVDLSYYIGEYGDEEGDRGDLAHRNNLLELTNFDGDDDSALPGEEALNRTVKKAGKLRRAKSRRASMALAAKGGLDKQDQGGGHPDRGHTPERSSGRSLLSPTSPTSLPDRQRYRHQLSTSREVDLGSPPAASYLTGHHPPWPASHFPPPTEGLRAPILPFPDAEHSGAEVRPASVASHNWDSKSDAASIRELIPRSRTAAYGEEIQLDMDEHEMRDVEVISEHARPGKPKVDRILTDEVQQSQGSVIVACCGPASLNAMVRKAISSQISPARIRQGDARGSVALVSEEFEY